MPDRIHHVATPVLEIAYTRRGPASGWPVVLLHGWPDDPLTWDLVADALAGAGYHVFCPWLRGYGPTRFLDAATPRSGQLAALGADVLDFADALGLARFSVVGHDWGARAAYIAAALAPERLAHCVALSVGWGTNSPGQPLSLEQARNYWYHWYLATPRGAAALSNERHAFTRLLWRTWSPSWQFTDAEFEATAHAFDNPDWAQVCINSYRHRWGYAEGDPRYAPLEARLDPAPVISVPTLVLHGDEDACNAPLTSAHREDFFSGAYQRLLVPGAGHFPQRENPTFVSGAILDWLAKAETSPSGRRPLE